MFAVVPRTVLGSFGAMPRRLPNSGFEFPMYYCSIVVGVSIALLAIGGAAAQSPKEQSKEVTIPLDEIWAYNMPGTRDAGKLESDKSPNYAYGPLVGAIRRSLAIAPPKGKDAKAGFAVFGTGLEALRESHTILVDNKKPRTTFPPDTEISVVFFSYQFGPYVHVHRAVRQGNIVNVYFRFVPHETEVTTEHFALIPLGKLPSGKFRVNVIQSPMEQKYVGLGFQPVSDASARRIVCQSFSFSVAERGG